MSDMSALLVCKDVSESIRFYEEKFGFKVTVKFPPAGVPEFANMVLGRNAVMLISHAAMLEDCRRRKDSTTPEMFSKNVWGVGVNLYLSVLDVDEMYNMIKCRKVRIIYDIENKPYGTREFTVADNSGYLLTFAQTKEFPDCKSCGMPMKKKEDFGGMNTDNRFCIHCTDKSGKLKSRQEVRNTMIQATMKIKNLTLQDAVKEVDKNMKKMPAWKD